MRSDMNKVVTERPRRGSRSKSLKTGRRLCKDEYHISNNIDFPDNDIDHGSNRHPISRYSQHGWDAKEFSDLIGPLRRYLHKQVGRPWNKIYSELSQSLDKRTVSGSHIWTHVFGEVILHCEIRKDNQVYEKRSRHYTNNRPVEGLYVHPTTGILCFAPVFSFKKKYPVNKQISILHKRLKSFGLVLKDHHYPFNDDLFHEKDWIIVDDLHVLENVNSKWMLHIFEDLNPEDVVAIKLVREKIVEVRRKDRKDAVLKQRIGLRQIGRRDKELWKLTQGVIK